MDGSENGFTMGFYDAKNPNTVLSKSMNQSDPSAFRNGYFKYDNAGFPSCGKHNYL